MTQRRLFVTSALPYANGAIHVGHLVGYIQADIWVRFQRMQDNVVHYCCADDTHGTPIMLRAEQEGITPEALIARVLKEHQRDFADFHVKFDNYHTTHSEETRKLSEEIYARIKAASLIERALEQTIENPQWRTADLGGPLGTKAFGERVAAVLTGLAK